MRVCLEALERHPVRVGAEAVAERPDAQHEVHQALGAAALSQRLQDLVRRATLDRRARQPHLAPDQRADHELVPGLDVRLGALAGGDRGEPQHHLPLGRLALGRLDHRRRPVGDAAYGQLVERGVVVGLRQRLRGGEDDVGVAGGLVDVDVDRDHEVELVGRRRERTRVRRRDEWVAGDRHQGAHAALAGRRDLLREPHDRQLAEDLGPAAHAAAPAPHAKALARAALAGRVALPGRGEREHRAALAVEVAGEVVEHVHEPARERPEALGRRPDPRVHGGALGGGQLARQPPDLVGLDPAYRRHGLGAEGPGQRLDLGGAHGVLGEPAGIGQALGEQHVGDREQQVRVRAGADEVVLGGLLGRSAAARVDDHDLAAALADRAQAAAHVGRGQQRAVGDQGVGAEDQQVVGAVDVGHGDAETAAEHERRRDLFRHLVDRRGRVDVLRAERLDQRRAVERRPEAVRPGVADVDGDRVAPTVGERRREPAVDGLEGLLPRGLDQFAVAPNQRLRQAVRVVVELAQALRLRAQEAVAEDVILVAAHGDDLVVAHRDLEPAGRFAERTGAVVDRLRGHGPSA